MIFCVVQNEKLVQENDKTRIDLSGSFSPDGELITKYEVSFDGIEFYDITSNKYIDWLFLVEDSYQVLARVSGAYSEHTKAVNIDVLSADSDKLFSDDSDLISCENDIMGFVRDGRNSFIDIHREAQRRILKRLDEMKIWDADGDKLTKEAIVDIDEVNTWSKYYVLEMIFGSLADTVDDIYSVKNKNYSTLRKHAEEHCIVGLDLNGDGEEDINKQDASIMVIKQV
jgi:hypothetical protein